MRRLSRAVMAVLVGLGVTWIAWAVLSPVLPPLGAAATIAVIGVTLAGLHLAAEFAERRGWIYYRRRHGSWGAVGAAMAEVQAIYRPGQHHVRQVRERADVYREEDADGDPPTGADQSSVNDTY
jgi:hypothetical protein